ncbi:MAG: S8 family serine peptidase [Lachnospiraceae bacterium]|nr:S8 family serine peptidase [Lachnospiraceae bacterium]
MNKRFFCFFFAVLFAFSAGTTPVGAVEINVPERIDGQKDNFDFYTETSDLISRYWEDDYFDTLYYSNEDGACLVDGEWYIPVRSFCKDAGISYKRSGKTFTMSSNEFTWECKINKKSSTFDGEKYVLENKPLKKNGVYVMNARDIDVNSCYDIEVMEDGISVTSPYQLKRLIVETKKGKKISPKSYGAVDYVVNGNTYILQFNTEKETKAAYEKLTDAKKVEYVEPDKFISMIEPDSVLNASAYDYYGSNSDWNVSMLGADKLAERLREAGIDRSVTVAVVDTGIDYTHSYLKGNVISKGYDFINNDYDAYDDNGHGTHVAGIIVNTISGANVSLLPVKVLSGQGYGSSLAVYNGILYASEAGADVINLSLGGASYGTGHYEDTAIQKAISNGCIVVVAAGNDSSDTAYECPAHNYDAIVVAAIDSNYNRAYFSNYGNSVDFSAPGVNIYSSVPGNGFESWSGTSMATPHISGLAALVKIITPSMTCSEMTGTLKAYAMDLGSEGFDVYYGYGVPYLADMEFDGHGYWDTTPVPTVTEAPVTPEPDPVITEYPMPTWEIITSTPRPTSTPKPTSVITSYPIPTWEIITSTPRPTSVITAYPTAPINAPTASPTQNPTPVITAYPTSTPIVTMTPIVTQPVYSGDTSCNISSSYSYSNNVGTLNISINAGSGVKNVVIILSNGTRYEYTNNGYGINEKLSLSGSGITATITAYDYYGNIVYYGSLSG